ncbi:hypothetical protein [Tardiphaga sp. 768_D3_N2_1]|uniref:hypothetical protein n=1 Tax=Tardiphaga sp. 768_D3_N2_1 TaxID=3240783 RepID=UPI003F8C2D3F
MKAFIATVLVATVVATMVADAASASERKHARRHVQQPGTSTRIDPREAYDYYPGWGREAVPIYGVYPGLIYGGATSAPAGR